jgi:uncharacterized protein (TIGR02172 family)
MNSNLVLPKSPIAHGRTAEVFEWGDGYVLKLFHSWFPYDDIKFEFKVASAVYASGVKSPAVQELIQVQGRHGLVYQRVQGVSIMTLFQQKPWLVLSYAKTFAQAHAQMHECVMTADVPQQQRRLQRKLQQTTLPVLVKASLLRSLTELPEGNRVCHGDFHPGNILLTQNDATIIDWIDASCGNPNADVARTSIILLGVAASKQTRNPFVKLMVKAFHATYLREYFRLRPEGRSEYQRWLPVVAGARLSENIPELETWLTQLARKNQ